MIKAVFIDYTDTMVQENEPYTRELLAYCAGNMDLRGILTITSHLSFPQRDNSG